MKHGASRPVVISADLRSGRLAALKRVSLRTVTSTPELSAPVPLDIEFPLRTRAEDAAGASPAAAATNASIGRLTAVASPLGPPLPFLVDRLLSAAAPFGLAVEIKADNRVVGSWSLDVAPSGIGEAYVSSARADLHVCASASAEPRATGAFLVVRHWSVSSSDRRQLEQLYAALSVATLERLDSLLGNVANETGAVRDCVLYLLDERRAAGPFRLDRLQVRLLEDLEGEHPIAGLDLLVAHGRGTGTRPHALASTVPTPLAGDADSGRRVRSDGARPAPSTLTIHEGFVPETVSPGNIRWNRRASDRARALVAAAEQADAAPEVATQP